MTVSSVYRCIFFLNVHLTQAIYENTEQRRKRWFIHSLPVIYISDNNTVLTQVIWKDLVPVSQSFTVDRSAAKCISPPEKSTSEYGVFSLLCLAVIQPFLMGNQH